MTFTWSMRYFVLIFRDRLPLIWKINYFRENIYFCYKTLIFKILNFNFPFP